MSAKQPHKPRQQARSNDEAAKGLTPPAGSTDRDAVPTGGAGATTNREVALPHSDEASLPEPPRDVARSATDMAPGIPTGSGEGIDQALEQPDSDIGGGVAGDTTVGLDEGDRRDANTVRTEDKGRTTL